MSDLNVRRQVPTAVISWNNGASAKAISEALSNGKLLRKDDSPLPRSVQSIINFGCKQITRDYQGVARRVINPPEVVQIAGSKVQTLQRLHHGIAPPFWTDRLEAVYNAVQGGYDIVCRTIDAGHSGAGIVLVTQAELQASGNLPNASVYVKAIQKRREYRVHIGCDYHGDYRVLDIARKVRRAGVPDGGVNGEGRPFVWNHGNDFIFQRSGIEWSPIVNRVHQAASYAVRSLGLHFGAVDVVVEAGGRIDDARVYVLEVNTAPGLEGTTLERYKMYFNHLCNRTPFVSFTFNSGEEYEQGGGDE